MSTIRSLHRPLPRQNRVRIRVVGMIQLAAHLRGFTAIG